jgi:single-stranded DNA-binding protein
MNNCVLMAKIVREPELRYTQDNQMATTQMLVEFHTPNPADPPSTLRVVGWGNLATEIKDKYREGDKVILVGRLAMNTIDRPEGFKEKRAEMVLSHIYGGDGSTSPGSQPEMGNKAISNALDSPTALEDYKSPEPVATIGENSPAQNLDDIPF